MDMSIVNEDVLPVAEIRRIAAEEGYQENCHQKSGEVLIFSRSYHEVDGERAQLPVCVEVYVRHGDVACFMPHARQRSYRLFHLAALYSAETFRNILLSPYTDNAFSYHLSELLLHPRAALPVNPPPCSLTSALERQITLIDREIGDLKREKHELKRRLHEFNECSLSSSYNKLHSSASSEEDIRSSGSRRNKSISRPLDASTGAAPCGSVGGGGSISAGGGGSGPSSKSSGGRARGNKGVWSLFYPDAQEEFARAWSFKSVASVALGRGFVISYDDGTATWSDISPLLDSKLRQQGITSILQTPTNSNNNGIEGGSLSSHTAASSKGPVRIRYLVLGDEGNFYVKFDNGRMEWCGQDSFGAALRRGVSERHLLVERVAFAQEGGWLIVWSDRTFEAENIPETLEQRLGGSKHEEGRVTGPATGIKDITLGPAGEWFVIYRDHSVQADNLPDSLYKCLSQIREKSGRVRSIAFGENRSWFVRYWDGTKV